MNTLEVAASAAREMGAVAMLLAQRFRAAVIEAYTTGGATVDLLPMVFAQAAVSVLPVTGAGLSIIGHLRIPLAASEDDVVTAERLQTTIGEGPCLAAVAEGEPLAADLARMAGSWPMFHERFTAETPYRSIAAFPLQSAQGVCLGALDLYSTGADPLTAEELDEVDVGVATPIASMLFEQARPLYEDGLIMPNWLNREPTEERMNVWIAVGMLMERRQLSNTDALALLRAYAYLKTMTLDQVARLMTERILPPEHLF